MRKIVATVVLIATVATAETPKELFEAKCAVCHKVEVKDKSSLIAPPVNKVMMHIKKSFQDKNEAVAFMKDYVIAPDPKKSLCPSIDVFGVMPAQKGAVSGEELDKILNYMYESFPANMQGRMGGMNKKRGCGCQGGKCRGQGRGFMRIDKDGDGFISKDEFNTFRAMKEGVDVKRFKYDYFFKRLDKNGDGKLDKSEFMSFRKMMRG